MRRSAVVVNAERTRRSVLQSRCRAWGIADRHGRAIGAGIAASSGHVPLTCIADSHRISRIDYGPQRAPRFER
jgi:hypothetical protein